MAKPEEIESKFYALDLVSEHTGFIRGMNARLKTIAQSPTFRKLAGGKLKGGLNKLNRDLEKSVKEVKWQDRMSSFGTAFQVGRFLQIPVENAANNGAGKQLTVLDCNTLVKEFDQVKKTLEPKANVLQ